MTDNRVYNMGEIFEALTAILKASDPDKLDALDKAIFSHSHTADQSEEFFWWIGSHVMFELVKRAEGEWK